MHFISITSVSMQHAAQHISTSAHHVPTMTPPYQAQQRRRQRPPNPLQTATAVAAVAVAAYGTYRLASWAWISYWNDEENDTRTEAEAGTSGVENSHRRRQASHHGTPLTHNTSKRRRRALMRQHRLHRCRSEVIAALADFLPTLKAAVERSTDFGAETEQLKSIRKARADRMRGRLEADAKAAAAAAESAGPDNANDTNGEKGKEVNADDDDEEEEQHAKERRRETELWESIKVKSLSRLLVTTYCHSLLLLVLTVQVHLLGGRLFREEEEEAEAEQVSEAPADGAAEVNITTNGDATSTTSSLGLQSRTKSKSSRSSSMPMPSYQATHRAVLTQTYGQFFSSGLADLLAAVEEGVREVFANYDVTDPDSMHITADQFRAAATQVRAAVEGGRSEMLRSALAQYIVPSEDNFTDNVTDPIAAHILEETWDVLESPTFAAAEREVLDVTFAMLIEGGWGGIFSPKRTDIVPVGAPQAGSTRPLAQVVTQLRRTTSTFYACAGGDGGAGAYEEGRPPNVYLPAVDRLPTLLELGDVGFN